MTSNAKTLPQKLLEVQQTIEKAVKSSSNSEFNSTYADLNEVMDIAKSSLNPLGVFISQGCGKDAYGQYVETSLINAEDGQAINGKVYFSGAEDNMHKIGAAITYARRIGLKALLAMQEEDDDGNAASGKSKPSPVSRVADKVAKPGGVAKALSTAAQAENLANPSAEQQVQAGATNQGPKASREVINKSISTYAQVILGKKLKTEDELKAMVKGAGAITKEKLSDEQAEKLLAQLQELVKPVAKAA